MSPGIGEEDVLAIELNLAQYAIFRTPPVRKPSYSVLAVEPGARLSRDAFYAREAIFKTKEVMAVPLVTCSQLMFRQFCNLMDPQQHLAGTFPRRLPVVKIAALEVELVGFVKSSLPPGHSLIKFDPLLRKLVFAFFAITHQLAGLAVALKPNAEMAIFLS